METLNWTLHPDGLWKAETPGGLVYTIEQTGPVFQLGTEEDESSAGGPSGQHGTIGVYSTMQRAQEAALAHARAHQLL
jgi:hypothetical protein